MMTVRTGRALLVVTMLATLAGVLVTPAAGWAMVILLRVEKPLGTIAIEGDSIVPGHEAEIELLGVSFNATNSVAGAGGGGGGSVLTLSDVGISKRVDKASPKIFLATATGTHYPKALVQFFDTTNKKGELILRFVIELGDVLFTSYQFGGNLDGMGETAALHFVEIKLTDFTTGTSSAQ
jgi:type VI secretion system secreted protein Hcp